MSLATSLTLKDSGGASKTFNQDRVEGKLISRIDTGLSFPEQRSLVINHQQLGKEGTPSRRWEHRMAMSHTKKDPTTGDLYTIYMNIVVGVPTSGPFALSDVAQLRFLLGYPSAAGTFSNGVLETTNWDAILRGES